MRTRESCTRCAAQPRIVTCSTLRYGEQWWEWLAER